jgi:adenosine deaminase
MKMDWFEKVPKVELHVHLEGAIPYKALWQLVQKYGGDPELSDLPALKRRFVYRDFPHFCETWMWKNKYIREYEDFTFIAEAVARDLFDQNIRYVEAFYSPPDFARIGLELQPITQAIRKGLDRVPQIEVALVADLVRDYGAKQAAVTLAKVYEVKDLGVIGIGIGGQEQKFPPELFKSVFSKARKLGFHTSAHAGEAAGAKSVWEAAVTLQAERIGHGTHAEEDGKLVEYLAAKKIPLEMCPISNVRTGAVKNLKAHPVRRYFDQGIIVTINTDDPKMFNNSLADEYRVLVKEFGFTHDEIRGLILQAIDVSWLPENKKQKLKSEFEKHLGWTD